jgi:hypothetical protein
LRKTSEITVAENPLERGPVVLVAAVGGAEGARGAAAALACAGADPDRASLFVDVGGRPPRPTLLASTAARELEERLVAHLPAARVAARGQVCHLAVDAEDEGFVTAAAAQTVARGAPAVVLVAPAQVQPLLADPLGARLTGALLRAELERDRSLVALAVAELLGRELSVGVLKRRLAWIAERRALFGTLAPGAAGGLPASLVERLLDQGAGPSSTGRGRGSSVPGTVRRAS